ncbi:MAG: hypothetical protein ACE5E8_06485 [Acidimicrobiia bacterium]
MNTYTSERVEILDGTVMINGLQVTEEAVVGLVAAEPDEDRPELVRRLLALGAQGAVTMGVGFDVDRVRETLTETAGRATGDVGRALAAGAEDALTALQRCLDPNLTDSLTAVAIGHVAAELRGIVSQLDLEDRNGAAARLVEQLEEMGAPDGTLARSLQAMLDPAAADSPLRRIVEEIRHEMKELRDMFSRDEGRSEEAARGTAKGFEFEDRVEAAVRDAAAHLGGAVVERTSHTAGTHGELVGDITIETEAGRVVVEAKDKQSLSLTGRGGVLTELDRAMSNRNATFAVCVSAGPAFPIEVGTFGIYGNRILVVDDGEGTLLEAAIRWAVATMGSKQLDLSHVDREALAEDLQRIEQLARRISSAKRALTGIAGSATALGSEMEELRVELLEQVHDAARRLRPNDPPAVRSVA